jgi:hypothetical protein
MGGRLVVIIVLLGLLGENGVAAGQREGPAATGGSRAVGHERAGALATSRYDTALRELGISRDAFAADLRRAQSMRRAVDAPTLLIVRLAARSLAPLTAAATGDEAVHLVGDGNSVESALSSAAHVPRPEAAKHVADARERLNVLLRR